VTLLTMPGLNAALTSAVEITASVIQRHTLLLQKMNTRTQSKYLHTQKSWNMKQLLHTHYRIMQLCHSPFVHWKNQSLIIPQFRLHKDENLYYCPRHLTCNQLLGLRMCCILVCFNISAYINHHFQGHILPEDN
jgi:hypothetical protein